jgi:hypothetical protein
MLDLRDRLPIIGLSLSEAAVSFQVTVLKVLAGHPGGRLPVDDLKRALAILMCSGPEWTDRTRRMLARAPGLDIFSQKLVIRDAQGWQITEAGRTLLAAIENPATAPPAEETPAARPTSVPLLLLGVSRRRGLRRRRRRRAA